ncbi:2-phospho-L-lactate guanylyltransferase [Arsenicicoccus dermatophilus]|uniref:2-phospho-L-lactate guanylyltransferase n=1 Tax=Arsenicicoccus dermatophilus TaxID=1076331 RepID=UPI0039171EE5
MSDSSAPQPFPWRVVIPVKDTVTGKSRLVPPEGISRNFLAMSIALDTINAARHCLGAAALVVVTGDEALQAHMGSWGVPVLPDPGGDLDAALRAGASYAVTAARTAGHEAPGVAALLGDLPGMHPDDLRSVLLAATGVPRGFVPDRDGTGTVLLTAAPGLALAPAFGPGSAGRHGEQAVDLTTLVEVPERLRLDVDVRADLARVAQLGVGRHTAMVLSLGAPD